MKPVDSVNNTRKCKISSVDTKTTGKVTRKNNVSPPKITSKRSRSNDKLQPAKKLKQCNSNQSNSVTNSTNTASETEGEDLPLSVYSNKSVPGKCHNAWFETKVSCVHVDFSKEYLFITHIEKLS